MVKMSGSEKESEQEHKKQNFWWEHKTYVSSMKRITRKFYAVVVQDNDKEMQKKSVLHV